MPNIMRREKLVMRGKAHGSFAPAGILGFQPAKQREVS
jgi:hypothetical protein